MLHWLEVQSLKAVRVLRWVSHAVTVWGSMLIHCFAKRQVRTSTPLEGVREASMFTLTLGKEANKCIS